MTQFKVTVAMSYYSNSGFFSVDS